MITYQQYVEHAIAVICSISSRHSCDPFQLTDERAWFVFQQHIQAEPLSLLGTPDTHVHRFEHDFPMLWSAFRLGIAMSLGRF